MPPLDPRQLQALLGTIDQRVDRIKNRPVFEPERKKIEEQLTALREQVGTLQQGIRRLEDVGDQEGAGAVLRIVEGLRAETVALEERSRVLGGELPAIPFAESGGTPASPRAASATPSPAGSLPFPPAPPDQASEEVEWRVREDARRLLENIMQERLRMGGMVADERNARLEVLALEWRLLKGESESYAPRASGVLGKCYAEIREAQETFPDRSYIAALNPKSSARWEDELDVARDRLDGVIRREGQRRTAEAGLAEKKRRESERSEERLREQEEAIASLRAVCSRYTLPEDPAGMAALAQAVETCTPHLKRAGEEVRHIVDRFRPHLETRFPQIWQEASPVEPAASAEEDGEDPAEEDNDGPPLDRRGIVRRILRRMKLKGEIGARHTKVEGVYRGVPGHARGWAKDAVDLLLRLEVLITTKALSSGLHIAINSAAMPEVDRIIDAGETTLPPLQRWWAEAG